MVNFIDEQPIRGDMTFKRSFPFAMKLVIQQFRRQGFFLNNHVHYFNKFINIFMAFFRADKVFLEPAGTERFKHGLTPQIRKQFLKRLEPFGWNLAPHHGSAFPNSGGSFSVGGMAFFAQRAFAFKIKTVISCRGKGKYNLSHRHFGGHVYGKPVIGGYFYGLRNSHHKENIA
jgi:hypothetical protein